MYNKPIRCISCKVPRCEPSCPCGTSIRDIIALVKEGKEKDAAELLGSFNPFPEWTSLLCDHERNCRGHCVLGIKGEPFDYPSLENYLAIQYGRNLSCAPTNGKRIAIIGAGPAGLTAAFYLAKAGYAVDVFERNEEIGGVLFHGIPAFRYEKARLPLIRQELESMGIAFHLNNSVTNEEIIGFCKDYHRIILACGSEKENTLGFEKYEHVVGGISLLDDLVHRKDASKYEDAKVAYVWGGGNVAMDCARSLARLGKEVHLIYRRSEKEMPAAVDEIAACKADGVSFHLLCNIKELLLDGDRCLGAKMVKMELGEPDESGRASFHEIEGSEYEIHFDLLVPALGEKIDVQFDLDKLPSALTCGDYSYGAKNIAAAIRSGRELAQAIIGGNK